MDGFIKLKGDAKKHFLQSKFMYYRKFNFFAILFSALGSTTYFISDCQLFGRFAWETLFPRLFILIPLIAFVIINSKTTNYLIMALSSQFMAHMMMWCTIGAIIFLPDKTHASEGFIIMHMVFLIASYASPFGISTISHGLVFLNIIISHQFNHYENIDIMFSLGLPCYFGIVAVNYVMCGVYYDTYNVKHQLEDSLVLDPLTMVFNRHKFQSITNGRQFNFDNSDTVSVLMADIDYFKKVNDTYGHDMGDQVLLSVASVIKSCTRSNDYIIRWGGEEFLIIMPNCPFNEAINVAERIREKVAATDNDVCPITISLGVASYDGNNYENAITEADSALYEAKKSGRNKVVGRA